MNLGDTTLGKLLELPRRKELGVIMRGKPLMLMELPVSKELGGTAMDKPPEVTLAVEIVCKEKNTRLAEMNARLSSVPPIP